MKKQQNLRKSIGSWLKKIRTHKGMTQEKLAERAEMSPWYYSEVERGLRNITMDNLQRIIGALDISETELLDFMIKANIGEETLELLELVAKLVEKDDKKIIGQTCDMIKILTR